MSILDLNSIFFGALLVAAIFSYRELRDSEKESKIVFSKRYVFGMLLFLLATITLIVDGIIDGDFEILPPAIAASVVSAIHLWFQYRAFRQKENRG